MLDATGDLFVSNDSGGTAAVAEYAPPYTSAPTTIITTGVSFDGYCTPEQLALFTSGGDSPLMKRVRPRR
jgi:hypothetical protein